MIGRIVLAAMMSLLLLCAAIGVMVLAYLWLVWYVSLHQSLRQRPLEDNGNGKPPKQQGLSEADLQRLPTIECCKEEEGDEQTGNAECAVCLEAFQSGDRCRVIPVCSHAFHVQCADAWLSKRSVCPLCRRSARENEEEKGVIVNGGAAVALQEAEGRDEELGRSRPPAADSVVVDMSIAITRTDYRD